MPKTEPQNIDKIIFKRLVTRQVVFSLFIFLSLLVASVFPVHSFLIRQQQTTALVSKSASNYIDSAQRMVLTLADLRPDQSMLDTIQQASTNFDTFYLIDSNGNLILSSPHTPGYTTGMDMSYQPYFGYGAASYWVSQPFVSAATGRQTVSISFRSPKGSLFVAELNLEGLQEIITETDLTQDEITYIAHANGELLAYPDTNRVNRQESIRDLKIIDKAIMGKQRQVYFVNGQPVIGTIMHIPETDWYVITQAPLLLFISYFLVPSILGLALISAIFIYSFWRERQVIARQFVNPLSQVTQAAERMARGDYSSSSLDNLEATSREIASLAASFERMKLAVNTREAALIESEKRWQFALEGPGDGVWDWNLPENRVQFSRQWKAMLGYSEDEVSPSPDEWVRRLHPDDRDRVLAEILTHVEQKTESYSSQHRIRRKDGSYIWVMTRGITIQRSADQSPTRVIGTQVDITSLIEAQQALDLAILQLEQKNSQLEESNASKDRLFSIIAHDLRGPLASFIALGQLFETATDMDHDSYLAMLNDFNASAERIMDLLDNLLTWARCQRGHIQIQPESFSVSRTAQRNIELLGTFAHQKGVTIKNSLSPDLTIHADLYMIDRVINNLLSNAVKFSQPGGCVEITADVDDDYVSISVSDTGVGMPDEILQGLFQIGSRVKQPGTAGEQGTGLGLMLCKEFVERNNGEILVSSRLGVGSTFTFQLPIKKKIFGSLGSAVV